MTSHNIKIAFRNLLKYKLQTSISILSLTVGMICFALSALWLKYENSYDSWWPEEENIYLVQACEDGSFSLEHGINSYLTNPEGRRLADTKPQIELMARLMPGNCLLKHTAEDEEGEWCEYQAIGDNVQEMLGIEVIDGQKKLKLRKDQVALTRSTAEKLFPGENAIGKKVWFDRGVESCYLNVVSIIEDAKSPTNFPYNFLKGIDEERFSDGYVCSATLVKVKPENVEALAASIESDSVRHQFTSVTDDGQEFVAYYVSNHSYKLLPLRQVRDNCVFVSKVVEKNHLHLFVILGVIVICCALFNYFTMLVTRIRIRQRELALRYVHGASRWQLTMLVATELLIIFAVSTLISIGVVSLSIDAFKEVCCIEEPHSFFICWFIVFASVAAAISITVAAIIIFVNNRKQIGKALDKRSSRPDSVWSYRINICLQLAVSIAAIFCSFVMMNQIHYLFTSSDMGFTKHNVGYVYVVCVNTNNPDDSKALEYGKLVENELKTMPEIDEMLFDYTYPLPHGFASSATIYADNNHEDGITCVFAEVDEDYFRFMEMQMVEGEFITKNDDRKMVCISEAAAKLLGDKGKVGAQFYCGDNATTVKGIVKDLAYVSPTSPSIPIIFTIKQDYIGYKPYFTSVIVKWKDGTDWDELKGKVESLHDKIDLGVEWHCQLFVAEEAYEGYIQSERMLCRLLMIVTGVCVIIAVCGIFSIVSLACERRRKEIAIRKVNGAKTANIIRLFFKEYVCMLLISAAIAFPSGYYLMHLWLMQYVKQAPVYWWIYPAIIFTMAFLIFLTIYWRICKAASENPSDVVKSE